MKSNAPNESNRQIIPSSRAARRRTRRCASSTSALARCHRRRRLRRRPRPRAREREHRRDRVHRDRVDVTRQPRRLDRARALARSRTTSIPRRYRRGSSGSVSSPVSPRSSSRRASFGNARAFRADARDARDRDSSSSASGTSRERSSVPRAVGFYPLRVGLVSSRAIPGTGDDFARLAGRRASCTTSTRASRRVDAPSSARARMNGKE